MKLLIQPGDGVTPLVKAINDAKKCVEILIFRFDRVEVENALVKAVARGVAVRALIAYTNRGGEKSLRALEMRLLAAGVTVARTADDLVRYHGKMMIVDGKDLHLMAFNFTNLDIERSRSFSVVTDDEALVQEATKLFDADSRRLPYAAGLDTFVVSPVNSRKLLTEFVKGAKTELLIYDPAVTDPAIARILQDREKPGYGFVSWASCQARSTAPRFIPCIFVCTQGRLSGTGEDVFLGSQSLRTLELDARREIGLILKESKIAARIAQVFEDDWEHSKHLTEPKSKTKDEAVGGEPPPVRKVAKKVAKTFAKALPPVAPVLEVVVRELAGPGTDMDLDSKALEETVKDAVKSAIQEVVASAVEQAAIRQPE